MGTKAGTRPLAGVIVTVVLVMSLAGPGLAAPLGAATPDLSPQMPPPLTAAQHTGLRDAVAAQLAEVRLAGPGPDAVLEPAATGNGDIYDDFCDDAGDAGVDLRRVVIGDLPAVSMLHFRFESCRPFVSSDLRGGVSLLIGPRTARSFVVTIHEVDGQLVGSVTDAATGALRHVGVAVLAVDGHQAGYDFPAAALDSPAGFAFTVDARTPLGDLLDVMPEAEEPAVGVWPGSCQTMLFSQQTVTATPGGLATALASVRAAGLEPGAVHPGSATFDVVLADAADVGTLRRLPGIGTVTATRMLPAPRPDARPAGDTADAHAADAGAWWRTQVGADRVAATGSGVTIGIVDNGIDGTRAELGGRVDRGFDVVRDLPLVAGGNSDRGGHGTLVAGVAAGASAAVTGIAPGARIRPYQVFDFAGCASTTAIAAAVEHAVADGVDVLNFSLGSNGVTPPELALQLVRAQQAGILVVAAAGNESLLDRPSIPAEHAATVAVGATGPLGLLAPYSNRAAWIELVAPGGAGNTPSTGILGLGERDGYDVVNGTSFSAPIVAGAAALYLEASGGSAAEARAALTATAVDLGVPGRDADYGFGLLDVEALLDGITSAPRPLGARDITTACRFAPPGRFPDVTATDVHGPGIDCVAHYEISGGFGDGTYRPGAAVTRGQMATFIANTIEATGGRLPEASARFADTAGSTHDRNVSRLADAEIVGGFRDGTYRPDAPVTRAQMAAFLVRALEYRTGVTLPTTDGGFGDIAGNAHEAAIGKAAGAGLTGGDGSGRYRPEGSVTRGQMGSFLARAVTYLVDTGSTTAR